MEHPFTKRRFRIPRQQIGYLRFILEGYEGLAFLRSLDGPSGRVEIAYHPSRESEADELLAALARELPMEEEGRQAADQRSDSSLLSL